MQNSFFVRLRERVSSVLRADRRGSRDPAPQQRVSPAVRGKSGFRRLSAASTAESAAPAPLRLTVSGEVQSERALPSGIRKNTIRIIGTEKEHMEQEITQQIIYGKNAVAEALDSDKEIDTVFIQKGAFAGNIAAMAKKRGIVVKDVSEEKLSALCGTSKHGGVAAELCAVGYSSLEEILAVSEAKGKPPFIVIADEIADPHNLGAIIRTAEAAGADGVIIPKRRSASLNATVFKTSAGAAAWIKIARVSNLVDTIKTLKKHNIWVYGMEADGTPYDKTDFSGGAAIVVGSEGFGLGRLVRESCDTVVSLPMNGRVNSLNASVSAGILMYEIAKHRK